MQSGGQCGHLIIDRQDLQAMLHEPGAKLGAVSGKNGRASLPMISSICPMTPVMMASIAA